MSEIRLDYLQQRRIIEDDGTIIMRLTVDSRFNDSQGTGVNLSLNRIIGKSNVVSVQNVHINDDRDRTKLSLNRAFR